MAARMCRWCDSVVPAEATTCPACGGSEMELVDDEPTAAGTNGLAVVAFVLAVLWLGGLGSVAAVILGSTAKAQIAERHQSGSALAAAAVVLGAFGIVGGALLAVAGALVVAG